MTKKKVVFVHYRTRELDGVSLEIEHRANVLRSMGHEVYYLTGVDGGKNHQDKVFRIPEMDIKSAYSKFLRENLFVNKLLDKHTAIAMYYEMEAKILERMNVFFEKVKPDLAYVHNLFAISYNLPATTALKKVLDKYETPTVVLSHDFWFTRELFKKPNYHFVSSTQEILPPKRHYILKQQVINSVEHNLLKEYRGIEAEIISDTFDFNQQYPDVQSVKKKIFERLNFNENDLIVLHATRITRRKCIENAIEFTAALQEKLKKDESSFQLHGREINSESRVRLLCPNFVESGDSAYHKDLKKLCKRSGVSVRWACNDFAPERSKKGGHQIFSFWDAYMLSDVVTYTSDWEGFGNQLIEALYFRKLLVLFEYPVFKLDIKQAGYQYVSLGDQMKKKARFNMVDPKIINRAAEETLQLLHDPEKLKKMQDKNFVLAKKHQHITKLEKDIKEVLRKI